MESGKVIESHESHGLHLRQQQRCINDVANFVLVDVRSSKDYAQKHAQVAINIHHSQMSAKRMDEFPADTLFVVYCWGPECNGADKAAYRLSQLGRPAKMMMGGLEYWHEVEKLPTVMAEPVM